MVLFKSMMTISVAEAKQVYSLLKPFDLKNISRSFDPKLFWEMVKRVYTNPAGVPGSGVGKGGGGGGSVRQSGGGLGKYGAAQEEGYFHHKQREQLEKLKKELKDNPSLTQKKDK